MKYALLLSLFLSLNHLGFGQHIPAAVTGGQIHGKVLDSVNGHPLSYATLTLFQEGKAVPVNGTVSQDNGRFFLRKIAPGTYWIRISLLGYQTRETGSLVLRGSRQVLDLGDINLHPVSSALKQVTVTSTKSLVENRIDKIVYDAEKDVTTQGGVATDVLKKVPEVSVDENGNVEVQGSSNIRVLIDGKPSTMFGSNLSEALQSIPASQIKSVEVITMPGAKYDAQGSGGILNLILKKNKARGLSGDLTGSLGSRLENGSFSLNFRRGTFGVFANLNGRTMIPGTTLNSMDRITYDSTGNPLDRILQNGNSTLNRHGLEGRLGFDWQINPSNDVSGTYGLHQFHFGTSGTLSQDQLGYNATGWVDQNSFDRNTDNQFSFQNKDWELAYKRTFSQHGKELDLAVNSSTGNRSSYYLQNQFLPQKDTLMGGAHSLNGGLDQERDITLDYTQPLSKNTILEAGAKTEWDKITSQTNYYGLDPLANLYRYDSAQSNDFLYQQQILAAYASMTYKLFGFVDLQTGLRYERTDLQADFKPGIPTILPGYNTWVPSIALMRTFRNKNSLKFAFTRRIGRPEYRDLNPFVNAVDPTNVSVGNPHLGPEIAYRLELSYDLYVKQRGSLLFTLFYHHSAHDIQSYVEYFPSLMIGDSLYKNVAVTTQQNIGLEQNQGLNIYGTYSLNSKIDIRSNLIVFDKYITNNFVPGTNANSFNYRINLNISYQITPTLVGEFFGRFRSPNHGVQGETPAFKAYDFGFRKLLFHKRGSIGFTTTNPFNRFVNLTTRISGPGFRIASTRKIPFRSFGLSFSYRFGKIQYQKNKNSSSSSSQDEGF